MNAINRSIQRMVVVIIAVFWAIGCGGIDGDSPEVLEAPRGDGPSDQSHDHSETESAPEGDDQASNRREVTYPFEPADAPGGSAVEPEPLEAESANDQPSESNPSQSESSESESGESESGESDPSDPRCAPTCFKALWCHGSENGDFADCIEQCEDNSYLEVVDESVMECVDAAEGCSEVSMCDEKVDPCIDVCGAYYECGWDANHEGCGQWCAGEFWAGRLDMDSVACVMEARESFACADLSTCGLSARD